jgi:DNA-binding HxlR family transcriptional regulator
VSREIYLPAPPKVEYSLMAAGEKLGGLLLIPSSWAKDCMPRLESGRMGVERPAAATK